MSNEYFSALRQGQVLVLDLPEGPSGDHVIVSQSCDVVLEKREMIQLAPVVTLDDQGIRRGALNGDNPRYPPVRHSEPAFADLGRIISLRKDIVNGVEPGPGIDPESEVEARAFGLAVGRWFGRFAFPDNIQPWLAPLQKLIREKYDRPSSPLGQALQSVSEIRVQASDPKEDASTGKPNPRPWSAVPLNLILHIIIGADALPALDDEMTAVRPLARLADIPSDLVEACQALSTSTDPFEKAALWEAIGAAFSQRCVPHGKATVAPQVTSAVHSVTAKIWSDDEFPLAMYRKSEQLDIDFLSDPIPL